MDTRIQEHLHGVPFIIAYNMRQSKIADDNVFEIMLVRTFCFMYLIYSLFVTYHSSYDEVKDLFITDVLNPFTDTGNLLS